MGNLILPPGLFRPTTNFASRAPWFNKFGGGACCCGKPVCMYGICRPGTVPNTVEVSLSHNGQIGTDPINAWQGVEGDETMSLLAGSTMHLTLVNSNSGTYPTITVCTWAARLCDIDAESGLYAVLRLTTGKSDGFITYNRNFCIRVANDDNIDAELANPSYWNNQSLIYIPRTTTVVTDHPDEYHRPFQLVDCTDSGPVFGSFADDEPDGLRVLVATRGGSYFCGSWNSDIIVSPVSEGATASYAAVCSYASVVLTHTAICKWFEGTSNPAYVMVEFDLTATNPSDDHIVDKLNGTHVAEYCSYWEGNLAAFYRCMYDTENQQEFRVTIGRNTCSSTYWASFVLHFITENCGTTYLSGSIGGGNASGSGCSATIPCDLLSNRDSWWYGISRSHWLFSGTATVSF